MSCHIIHFTQTIAFHLVQVKSSYTPINRGIPSMSDTVTIPLDDLASCIPNPHARILHVKLRQQKIIILAQKGRSYTTMLEKPYLHSDQLRETHATSHKRARCLNHNVRGAHVHDNCRQANILGGNTINEPACSTRNLVIYSLETFSEKLIPMVLSGP